MSAMNAKIKEAEAINATRGASRISDHSADWMCTVDPATDSCTECGTYHGDPCPECTGRAYHFLGCSRIEVVSAMEEEAGSVGRQAPRSFLSLTADDAECASHLAPVKRYFAVEDGKDRPRHIGPCAEDVLQIVLGRAGGTWRVIEWTGPGCQLDSFVYDGADYAPDWKQTSEGYFEVVGGGLHQIDPEAPVEIEEAYRYGGDDRDAGVMR